MKTTFKPWPSVDEYDGESAQLMRTVEHGWDCQFPGWQWVADEINDEYGNDRSAAACRSKWVRLSRHNAEVSHGCREHQPDTHLTHNQP
jgi:hypothetical protein